MITFSCPACQRTLRAPDNAGGFDATCSCGRTSTVPPVIASGSRPAIAAFEVVTDSAAPSSPEPQKPPTPEPKPERLSLEDNGDDDFLERAIRARRNRRARRKLVALASLTAALTLTAAFAVTKLVLSTRAVEAHNAEVAARNAAAQAPVQKGPAPRTGSDPTPGRAEARKAGERPTSAHPRPGISATSGVGTAPSKKAAGRPPAPINPEPADVPPDPTDPFVRRPPVDEPPPKPFVVPRDLDVAPAPRQKEYKSDRPAKEALAGYYRRDFSGFTTFVSAMAYEKSDEEFGRPLKVVADELERISELFPEPQLKALRKVSVWVEWDHTIPRSVNAFAVFYGNTGHTLLSDGVDPRKAQNVCVLSLKTAYRISKNGGKQNALLHEFAHAVHGLHLKFDNTFVQNAFDQARARKLYDSVRHDDDTVRPAYARRSHAEYFAELTCAYLDRLDYPPHDAKELKDHDSVGYELMVKVYGSPEQLAKARAKERESKPGRPAYKGEWLPPKPTTISP